ncbi:unnamed protein product [Prorocentrum cordatum]|uniref:Tubulin--tyrosine ligase-like protein 9 n=1 Tax=Prorocentrum cordatum TaxID=2364126 RepID=A0ABN9T1H7_9DINO|nr:unnamed protein product [Polarella glacialis]
MWSRIMDMAVKTLLSVEPFICAKTRHLMHNRSNCFEVYGFDAIVDEDLKPWLLEVNLSPSMQAESPLDWQIKSSLLTTSSTWSACARRTTPWPSARASGRPPPACSSTRACRGPAGPRPRRGPRPRQARRQARRPSRTVLDRSG